jgi:hypothetical protein
MGTLTLIWAIMATLVAVVAVARLSQRHRRERQPTTHRDGDARNHRGRVSH